MSTITPGHTKMAPRRLDRSLVGQLNLEWDRLCVSSSTLAVVAGWAAAHEPLARCATLTDVERRVAAAGRADADHLLLTLIQIGQSGDELALRTVVQLMLGKAVRIAAGQAGRAPQAELEHTAVAALWTVVSGYPVERRPLKVAANIAMDTLHRSVAELTHQRYETAAEPAVLSATIHDRHDHEDPPVDLELLRLLTWAVDGGIIRAADAALIVDIYSPAPGEQGGPAAADRHGVSWPTARQRASRAVRRIAQAVREDTAFAAA